MPTKKKPVLMPSSLLLSGRRFKLGLVEPGGLETGTMGQYIPMEGRIIINHGMPADQTKATALHEVIHDFSNQSTNDLTETQVNSVAALLFAALRDNPAFVAWLMDR